MKIKNILGSLLLGGSLLVTPACNDDFLEMVQPANQTDGTFFQSADDAEKSLIAAYSVLNHLRIAQTKFILGDIASDDAVKGSTDTDGSYISEIKSFTAPPGNIGFRLAWYPQWNGIYYANLVLQQVPNIDMDEARKQEIFAEAKFLRAFYYFEMAKNFGGLPLFPEPAEVGAFAERATLDETYNFIAADLQDAINTLPKKSEYSNGQLGRATRGAAVALLGKVYVYQKKWTEAASTLSRLTEGDLASEYALPDDFEGIFRFEGEHASGSVFEINYLGDDFGTWDNQGNFGTVFQMPRLWGWGFNQPTISLVDEFEVGDPRLKGSIISYLEAQVLEDPDLGNVVATKNTGYYQRKSYLYPDERPGWWRQSSVNYRAIRLADVYLLHAEAAAQSGDEAKARQLLNTVRNRAKNSGDMQGAIGFNVVEVPINTVADNGSLASLAQDRNLIMVDILQDDSPMAGALKVTNISVVSNAWVISEGTVIQSIDGTTITSQEDFYSVLRSKGAGSSVSVQYATISQNADGTSTTTDSQTATVTLANILPEVTASGSALLNAIYHERRVELASEHHRFYDIVRTGRGPAILGSAGFKEGVNEVYPIPQDDIDKSNGALVQNPGY